MFDEINLFIFTKVSKIFIPQDLRHTSFSLKFSFSEKATKICEIVLMVLTFTKYTHAIISFPSSFLAVNHQNIKN